MVKTIKRGLLVCASILCVVLISYYFNSNRITCSKTKRLATLAKTWGFLKYYHQGVEKGIIDWDSVLIVYIRLVKQTNTKKEFNTTINTLINLVTDNNCNTSGRVIFPDSVMVNIDFSWMEDRSIFLDENIKQLLSIKTKKRNSKNYYVCADEYVGKAIFTNEKSYPGIVFPNEEYRLLALFRYWNAINYFYPYKYLITRNWEDVLLEYIPRLQEEIDSLSYHLSILELTILINDSHSNARSDILNNHFGHYFLPVKVSYVENSTIITDVYSDSLAKLNNLLIGDIITKINGIQIDDIRNKLKKIVGGSNISSRQRNINYYVVRNTNDSLNLVINRAGTEITVKSKLYLGKYLIEKKKEGKKKKYKKIYNETIGYINLGTLEKKEVNETILSLLDTKAIIFDLREYPRFILYDITKYLIPSNRVFALSFSPNFNFPGIIKYNENCDIISNNDTLNHFKGTVITLVNEKTQSRGEFTCMALQTAPKSLVIGSQSAGADGNVSYLNLPGEITVSFSGTGVKYPNGLDCQRNGVKIDILVKQTLDAINSGRDNILEEAIEVAKQL